jgi:4-hydroxybenzoate polyprenyltransferase
MTTVPVQSSGPRSLPTRVVDLARDIKVSHTVFALPFAVLSAFVAAGGFPGWGKTGLVLFCMVAARTAAMTANRLLDAGFDGENPRTKNRAIPAGRLSHGFVMAALVASAAAFGAGATGFWWAYGNKWPVTLAPVVLGFLCAYPLMKRWTWLCHFYLGVALGLAPVCAWIAVKGGIATGPVVLGLAVFLWTAGFDILYACQDWAVDVAAGLHSVPAWLGIRPAMWVARGVHVLSAGTFVLSAFVLPGMGQIYLLGVAGACGLLVYQHYVVRGGNLARINLAFFTLNGMMSVLLGTLGLVDVFI